MTTLIAGPHFQTLVCKDYEDCGFYENPIGMPRKTMPPHSICPDCGAKLVVGVGRFTSVINEYRYFFGLIKSRRRELVGFELKSISD